MLSAKQKRRMAKKARRRLYLRLRDRMRTPGLTPFERVNAIMAYHYRTMMRSLLAEPTSWVPVGYAVQRAAQETVVARET